MLHFLLIGTIFQCVHTQENMILLTKKRSSFLENYRSYADLAISQVVIPPEVQLLSFKISAEPFDLSIFGCSPEEVEVYVKKGSIPVINPDNSKIPDLVRNISKSSVYGLKLLTDKKFNYINITSPEPGIYYFVSFFPYVDPNKVAVKQKGLSQHCTGFINILTYISKPKHVRLLRENSKYEIYSRSNGSYYYQFSTTPNIKELFLRIKIIESSHNETNLTLRLSCESLPSENKYLESKTISITDRKKQIPYWLNKDGRYFLEFEFQNNKSGEIDVSLEFSLDTLSLDQTFRRKNLRANLINKLDSDFYKGAIIDFYDNKDTNKVEEYYFYDLIKESGSESFLYTFNIRHEKENEFMVPIPINLTSEDFSALKFKLDDVIDVGGMFEFSIDFRLPLDKNREVLLNAESVDQVIIGCISQDIYQIPTLPRHCMKNGVRSIAPVVVNNTVDNSTVLIPYPEAGTWYVTLKLFCRPCRNCPCYKRCSDILTSCISQKCNCKSMYTCDMCLKKCKQDVAKDEECQNCNCDDYCEASSDLCNSTLVFDLSSFPCLMGRCGPNGRCQFMVADGYIFSACRCRNKYRGMDCTDDSNATPYWKVVLAQVLLISSNVIMLPCVYLAVRRKFYSEAVMYFFVFLFSSFYHACDVSDDGLQFCLTTHSSLQFGDFFSALLSIWATLLAIADVQFIFKAALHVFGAIILAYCTVIDRTGFWIFLLITIPGFVILGVSWFMKYKKVGRSFIRKKYAIFNFSIGAIVMGIGVSIYAFFQTSGNYMYLHSLWHCIVGVTVLLVLPRPDTFVPIQNT